ncbi:hypothetical protein BGW42_007929 [Actinomortierella wolfii]|nr:hypothetical protein BGW42_007929 [Actinomortierella wolfii]
MPEDMINRVLEGRRDNMSYVQLARQEGVDRHTLRRHLLNLLRPFLEDADVSTEPQSTVSDTTIKTPIDHPPSPTLSSANVDDQSCAPHPREGLKPIKTMADHPGISAYPLLATAVLRPWTAQDRDRLMLLSASVPSWETIAQALERDVLTCREKYHQLQRARIGTPLHVPAARKRNPYWAQLRAWGFTPAHRDRLVKILEEQQQQRQQNIGRRGGNDAQRRNDGHEEDRRREGTATSTAAASLEELFVGHPGPQGVAAAAAAMGILPGSFRTSEIDWEAAAQALGGEFTAERLQMIYKVLATARLIWTEQEDVQLIQMMIRRGGRRRSSSSHYDRSDDDNTDGNGGLNGSMTTTLSDEIQERLFWAEVRDSLGDPFRTPEDYKDRWRVLDMPLSDREWDAAEQTKFWRRFIEFHRLGSLINTRLAAKRHPSFAEGKGDDVNTETKRPTNNSGQHGDSEDRLLQLNKAALMKDTFMWDTIAEGLEYRHGRDCQAYFERMTQLFPRDPDLFGFLVNEMAQRFVKPARAPWSPEDAHIVFQMATECRDKGKPIAWASIAEALEHRYTERQIKSKYFYLCERAESDRSVPALATVTTLSPTMNDKGDESTDTEDGSLLDSGAAPYSSSPPRPPTPSSGIRAYVRWTDKELELLRHGVAKYFNDPQRWRKIQQEFLPHRTRNQLRERYERLSEQVHGRFTGKEQRLLEEAIEFLGEGASWEEVAQMVPGRTARQCRQAWNYGSMVQQHIGGESEGRGDGAGGMATSTSVASTTIDHTAISGESQSWSPLDHERLIAAVDRYGTRRWSKVAEVVVGKTAIQCRNEWRSKLNPAVSYKKWTSDEVNRLMERVSEYLTKQEEVEYEAEMASQQRQQNQQAGGAISDSAGVIESSSVDGGGSGDMPPVGVFEDTRPRYKGKVKIDWNIIAEGMPGRGAIQCYEKFQSQRKTYRLLGDF